MNLAIFLCLFFIGGGTLFPQESLASTLSTYQQNFIRADLADKVNRLQDAAKDPRADEFMGEFYDFALQFTLYYAQILSHDIEMSRLVEVAAQGIEKTGHTVSVGTLMQLLSQYTDTLTAVALINALATVGKGQTRVHELLNSSLSAHNAALKAGREPDTTLVLTCINALVRLGDSGSYPVLFSSAVADYPDTIKKAAAAALETIPGNLQQFLIEIIKTKPVAEKRAAFAIGAQSSRLSNSEQGALAESALAISLLPEHEHDSAFADMRYQSIILLIKAKWTSATPLVIEHYHRVLSGYQSGMVDKIRLIEAISALGAMKSTEASQELVLELGYLNAQTEARRGFDTALVLAVIQALGTIGDKQAFDQLLYVDYLPYPEALKSAARNALSQLKW
ncbi:MAG: hypothetical protein LBO67_05790 [Spirochaetaceae bacterium]|jgi:hypothetical protein|nr:hypothetical protein [Spirochaetaceae bacterium]